MPAPRYTMPAEWAPHAGTWLGWPHRRSDWPGKFAPVRWVYAEIVKHLSRTETVNVLVQNAGHEVEARTALNAAGADLTSVKFLRHPTDRGWLRDSGPIFARDSRGKKVALGFRFTGWAKYDDWHLDALTPRAVAAASGCELVEPTLNGHRPVLEGGSIDVNGAGTILTTEECLLSKVQERNPPFTRGDYEQLFAEYLGATRTVWLGHGIAGDDTHGHVDDLARFVDETTVVLCHEADPADANTAALADNLERLQSATDARGRKLTVVPLPMPAPVVFKGVRLPASYANFLVGNGAVLVPTFNDPADRVALGTLAELFPGRRVVGVHAVDLVWGLGTVHCMTQQEPA